MASMLNLVVIEGYLGADAETKTTDNGRSLTKLRVANTRKWKTKGGEVKDETTWVNVTSWNDSTKNILDYLTKGRQIKVVGRLHANSYQDKDGANRVAYEVLADDILLGSSAEDRKAAMDASGGGKADGGSLKAKVRQTRTATADIDDDDMPW